MTKINLRTFIVVWAVQRIEMQARRQDMTEVYRILYFVDRASFDDSC